VKFFEELRELGVVRPGVSASGRYVAEKRWEKGRVASPKKRQKPPHAPPPPPAAAAEHRAARF
jgi:hypothetical protein